MQQFILVEGGFLPSCPLVDGFGFGGGWFQNFAAAGRATAGLVVGGFGGSGFGGVGFSGFKFDSGGITYTDPTLLNPPLSKRPENTSQA